MMTAIPTIAPEYWLFCDEAVHAQLVNGWARAAPAGSLPRLRLDAGLIELTSREQLLARAQSIASASGPTAAPLHIVFDELTYEDIGMLREVARLGLPLRVRVWRQDSLAVVDSIFIPEESLLDAWAASQAMPTLLRWGHFGGESDLRYILALVAWELAARAEHDDFDEMYGTQVFPADEPEVSEEVWCAPHLAAGEQPQLRAERFTRSAGQGAIRLEVVLPVMPEELATLYLSIDAATPRLDDVTDISLHLGDVVVLHLGPPEWVADEDLIDVPRDTSAQWTAAFDQALTPTQLQAMRSQALRILLHRGRPDSGRED